MGWLEGVALAICAPSRVKQIVRSHCVAQGAQLSVLGWGCGREAQNGGPHVYSQRIHFII